MARRKKNNTPNFLTKSLIAFIAFFIFTILVYNFPKLLYLLLVPILYFIFSLIRKNIIHQQEKELYLAQAQQRHTIGTLIAEFHEHPTDFEYYVADLFEFYGFETEVTPGSNDGGKDIVMHKDGQKCVVEVKLYATHNKISREKIQKLHSAMGDCRADYAIYVTTSSYTSTAVEFAARNNIELIDGFELVNMIQERANALNSTEFST